MLEVQTNNQPISFSSIEAPDTKIAPIVVAGAVFLGRAAVGAAVGTAASWGTQRILDNTFPKKK